MVSQALLGLRECGHLVHVVKELDLDKKLFTFFAAQLAISTLAVLTSLQMCTDANGVAIFVGNSFPRRTSS